MPSQTSQPYKVQGKSYVHKFQTRALGDVKRRNKLSVQNSKRIISTFPVAPNLAVLTPIFDLRDNQNSSLWYKLLFPENNKKQSLLHSWAVVGCQRLFDSNAYLLL